MKFRKKPVVIEAFVFRQDPIPDWFMDKVTTNEIIMYPEYCEINTLEGTMIGNLGDYIIKGVKGEIYPCKPDIFEQTYELETADDTEFSGKVNWFDNFTFNTGSEYIRVKKEGDEIILGISPDGISWENVIYRSEKAKK
jgi:hypothetical protein